MHPCLLLWASWESHIFSRLPCPRQDQRLILERLQVVYTVGYSLSLAALLLALLILSLFR